MVNASSKCVLCGPPLINSESSSRDNLSLLRDILCLYQLFFHDIWELFTWLYVAIVWANGTVFQARGDNYKVVNVQMWLNLINSQYRRLLEMPVGSIQPSLLTEAYWGHGLAPKHGILLTKPEPTWNQKMWTIYKGKSIAKLRPTQ
jgi:hypothetical protein